MFIMCTFVLTLLHDFDLQSTIGYQYIIWTFNWGLIHHTTVFLREGHSSVAEYPLKIQ